MGGVGSGRKLVDRTGQRFGRLTVQHLSHSKWNGRGFQYYWKCICDCSGTAVVTSYNLTHGVTQSCGCLRDESTRARCFKHGHHSTHSKEYRAWQAMKNRCGWAKHKDYRHYGGRGIRVADVWLHDFLAFYEHIGRAPSAKHVIDRIDVNGHYEPGNVRWVTPKESVHNRRNSR